jgi:hypothetical protein
MGKLSPYLINSYTIKMYGGVVVQLHPILTFKIDRSEKSALLLHRQLLSTVDWKHKHQTLSGYYGADTNPFPHQQSNYICLVFIVAPCILI